MGERSSALAYRRSQAEVDRVYQLTLLACMDRKEMVRLVGGGSLDAADWTMGVSKVGPVSGRQIAPPSVLDVQMEYLTACAAKSAAEDEDTFVYTTGVVDWLGFLVDPGQDTPWWEFLPQVATAES